MPALLMRMSRRPNFCAAPLTKARHAASVPTSACVKATLAPAVSSSATTRWPRSPSRSQNATLAPSATKRLTVASPIPDAPPVTAATLPSSLPTVASFHCIAKRAPAVGAPSARVFAEHDPAAAAWRGEGGQRGLCANLDLARAGRAAELLDAVGVHGGAEAPGSQIAAARAERVRSLDPDIAGVEREGIAAFDAVPLEGLQEELRHGGIAVVRIEYIDVVGPQPGALVHPLGGAVGPVLDLGQIFLGAALPEIML